MVVTRNGHFTWDVKNAPRLRLCRICAGLLLSAVAAVSRRAASGWGKPLTGRRLMLAVAGLFPVPEQLSIWPTQTT